MSDTQKRLGFYQNGTVSDAKTRQALASKGHRVMPRNAIFLSDREPESFDILVAGEGVDVGKLRTAFGDKPTPVMTVAEFMGSKAEPEKKADKPFDPDADPKKQEPKKQG
jgi:hypothetical protein